MCNIYEATSIDALEALLKKTEGITFVDFYQPTCGPCIMLEPVFEEMVEKNLVNIIKVDVADYPEIGIKYQINVTPTILIYKNNEFKETIKGYMPIEEWIEIIKKI